MKEKPKPKPEPEAPTEAKKQEASKKDKGQIEKEKGPITEEEDLENKVYKVKLFTIDGERDIDNPANMNILDAAEASPNIVH